jgi:excisionase family DNA binding protein
MTNPFEEIQSRLTNIETLILDLRTDSTKPDQVEAKEQLLDVKETAEFLKLTVPTIYSKVSRGELPVMKGQKRLYFSRTELLEHLKGKRKKTNSELDKDAQDFIDKKK